TQRDELSPTTSGEQAARSVRQRIEPLRRTIEQRIARLERVLLHGGARRRVRNLLYRVYERRLRNAMAGKPMPRHVGVMCDGNRRWARDMGSVDPNDGHRVGAENVKNLLAWCDEVGVEHITLYLLATRNLSRPARELDPLVQIIEDLAGELAEEGNPWRLNIVGALDLLPSHHAIALKTAQERTRDRTGGALVN